jgi:hypothetical protein
MKKLMTLAAMLAMTLLTASPTLAQTLQIQVDDLEGGNAETVTEVINEGANANHCFAILSAANTGNVQNLQGVLQYNALADDIEVRGASIIVSPELAAVCEQMIEQAAAAGAAPTAPGAAAFAPAQAQVGGDQAPAPAPQAQAGGLPPTGGVSLVGIVLSAGALLVVGGGLIGRRFIC